MNLSASFGGNFIPLSQCSSYTLIRFQPLLYSPRIGCRSHTKFISHQLSRTVFRGNVKFICRVSETETESESNNDEQRKLTDENDELLASDLASANDSEQGSSQPVANDESADLGMLQSESPVNENVAETNVDQPKVEDVNDIQVASGSPLPGVKPQQLDESIRIPKETIEILRDQVFGFDTFFVTSQEPYEAGILFKGNLRGQAARSYEKITKRMEDRFGDQYKLFLLINPEDDKPVAVVVPRQTLQPEAAAVPEWFAAGAFGLVTIFTLLLRNVPALQANVLSIFDNIQLLEYGLPGALVTALVLAVHEISHALVAKEIGIKLGVPYFVPSWQVEWVNKQILTNILEPSLLWSPMNNFVIVNSVLSQKLLS